jgi:flagellar M-ring protein FliF
MSRPTYGALYVGLEPSEASKIVRSIEQMGIPYQVSSDGGTISIPQNDFARVRMAMAEQGLPSKGGVGYELFDQNSALGMTSFMQKVNRVRAMEGELARTIQALKGVEAARVHIVLPEREAFSHDKPDPTASVVVRTKPGTALEKAQAQAIRHLIASSVPGLKASGVTVLDANGDLILADDGTQDKADLDLEKARVGVEARLSKNIEQMLTASFGPGNVRVQVSAEIDQTKQVIRSQKFDPKEQVVRSTQTTEEKEESADSKPDNVSVQNNVPQGGQQTGQSSRSAKTKTDETVNYEISKVESESVMEPGSVKRLSVAVLINAPKDGKREQAEIDRITNLVKSAMGYKQDRGDVVTVDSMAFKDYSLEASSPMGTSVGEVLSTNLMTIIQWVVMLSLAGLLMAFGVRPLLNIVLIHREQQAAAEQAAQTAAAEAEAKRQAMELDENATTQLEGVNAQVRVAKLRMLSEVVGQHPEEAVKVLKGWVSPEVQ